MRIGLVFAGAAFAAIFAGGAPIGGTQQAWAGEAEQRPANAVRLTGDFPTTGSIGVGEVRDHKAVITAAWKDKSGKFREVKGLPLEILLTRQGLFAGREDKALPADERVIGNKLGVIARGRDGYSALFSYAELAGEIGSTRALLVYEIDGQPLTEKEGPLRLCVPTDQTTGRSVWGLDSLQAVDTRKLRKD